MDRQNLTLLTDLYELTMMQGYFKNENANQTVIFDMFYRTNPLESGYAIMAGLEQMIEYIKELRFEKEDIDYLRSLAIFREDFLEYLKTFRFTGTNALIKAGLQKAVTTGGRYDMVGRTYAITRHPIHALNEQGSSFVHTDEAVSVPPFRAYFVSYDMQKAAWSMRLR